jgi:hypothetical protein
MIDSLSTTNVYCRTGTGNVGLLSKTENAPTSSARLQQKLTHATDLSGRTSKLDTQNHRTRQTTSSEHTSNPHSSAETTQQHLLRPRGFLP